MAEDGGAQGTWRLHHLPGRGKEAPSGPSRAGTSLWGLHQSGRHQSAALSPSSGGPPAIIAREGVAWGAPSPEKGVSPGHDAHPQEVGLGAEQGVPATLRLNGQCLALKAHAAE